MTSMISEAEIRSGLASLSDSIILSELGGHPNTAENIDLFLELLQRSNHLFFKYPNPKQEKKRDEFLAEIENFISQNFDNATQTRFTDIVSLIRRVELGYRNILHFLEKLPTRKRSGVLQSTAVLELAARRLDFIEGRTLESLQKAKSLSYSDEVVATLDDGSEFNVDAATTGFVENLGTTIKMFAHENRWITPEGIIELPSRCECTQEDISEVSGTEFLATSWRRWERVEQRRRYWGGQFINYPDGKALRSISDVRVHFEYLPGDDDIYDWIANERFKEYIMQNLAELRYETFAADKVTGIAKSPRLPPEDFVSIIEVNAASLLSTELGVDVYSDSTLHAGLRIVEWIRGYCTLSEIAAQSIRSGKTPAERNLITFEPGQLESRLTNVGLSSAQAERFIANAMFTPRSVDLFDCPLLQVEDGSILFFAPAAVHVHPAIATYSNLASMDDEFEGKGERFEQAVTKFFKGKGFNPYSIRTTRNGEIDLSPAVSSKNG
jgi:hypothetical protein